MTTDPAAGTTVARGSAVTLDVSRGNELTVPSVVGETTSEALATLSAAGFTGGQLNTSSQSVNDPSQDGKVLSQSPSSGGTASAGDSISVVVGRYSGGNGNGNGSGNGNGGGTPSTGSGGGLFPNGLFPN